MKTPMTPEQAIDRHFKLQRQIEDAMAWLDGAERAFNKLKYGNERGDANGTTPEWTAVCAAAGIREDSDFGDWCRCC